MRTGNAQDISCKPRYIGIKMLVAFPPEVRFTLHVPLAKPSLRSRMSRAA